MARLSNSEIRDRLKELQALVKQQSIVIDKQAEEIKRLRGGVVK